MLYILTHQSIKRRSLPFTYLQYVPCLRLNDSWPTPRHTYRYTTLKEEALPLKFPICLPLPFLVPFPGTPPSIWREWFVKSGLPPMENGPGRPALNRHRRLECTMTG